LICLVGGIVEKERSDPNDYASNKK
jgi:hypothetical protein